MSDVALVAVMRERDRYHAALKEIAKRATVERNPDSDDQAAATMQLIAREALGLGSQQACERGEHG